MAHRVIRAGRAAAGHNDVRCTISIGGFVPKPHTPFQWAAQAHPDVVDERLRKLRAEVNAERKLARNIGMRYHDGKPVADRGPAGPRRPPGGRGDRAGLAGRRPVRRLERALRLRPRGPPRPPPSWSRWASRSTGSPPASATATRSCPGTTWTPGWSGTGSGTTGRTRWPAGSRTTAAGPRASTAASARPPAPRSRSARAGPRLLPLTVVNRSPAVSTARQHPGGRHASARPRPGEAANPAPPTVRGSGCGSPSAAGCASCPTATSRAASSGRVRRAGVPVAHSHGFSPHPRLSWVGAAPTGTASEAEYLEIGLTRSGRPGRAGGGAGRGAARRARRAGRGGRPRAAPLADRIDASRWSVELPGVAPDQLRAALAALLAETSVVVERITPSGRRRSTCGRRWWTPRSAPRRRVPDRVSRRRRGWASVTVR